MAKESRAGCEKPCGIETEFGINGITNDRAACGTLFVSEFRPSWFSGGDVPSVAWDPRARVEGDSDIRDDHAYFHDISWRERANFILPNGARFYLDGAHAEISSPLCLNAKQLLRWNRACYRRMDEIRRKHKETRGHEFVVYRNNVAGGERSEYFGKKNSRVSFGCHENYTTFRSVPEQTLIKRLGGAWFPARVPIIGAGKVGNDDYGFPPCDFQMSQRADFFVNYAHGGTMHSRPIYNTRDVPYADANRFRRVHVICGDANMLQLPEYLKIGLTSILLMMIEDETLDDRFEFLDPISAMHEISRDISFQKLYLLRNQKKRRSVLYLLASYRDVMAEYIALYHPHSELFLDLVSRFSEIVDLLSKRRFGELYGVLDWATKYHIIQSYLSRRNFNWKSHRAIQLDYEYHNNDHERGIFFRGPYRVEKHIVPDADIQSAMSIPPPTRSRWICEMLKHYNAKVAFSNYWDRVDLAMTDEWSRRFFVAFPDPHIPWNEEYLQTFFSLPLLQCLRKAKEAGMISIGNERNRARHAYQSPF